MASPIMRDPQYGGRLSMMQPRTGMVKEQIQVVQDPDLQQVQEMPATIITDPELAMVGNGSPLTEEDRRRGTFFDPSSMVFEQDGQLAIGFGPAGPNGGWSSTSGGGYGPYGTGNNPSWSWTGGFNPQPTENQNPILPTGGNPYSGGSSVDDKVYGGLGLTGLLSGNLGDALRTAGGYYAGQQGIEGAYQTGLTGLETAERMGQRALEGSQFRPFGVTSDLANVQAGAQGDVNLGLSGQQQRLQNQLLGGAQQQFSGVNAYDPSIAAQRGAMGGLFGQQLGQYGQPTGLEGVTQAGLMGAQQQFGRAEQPQDIQDLRSQYGNLAMQAGQGLLSSPEQRQSDIYESIRATQRPEEERQALRMRENLLSQGRSGVRTADYGGTPEQLAMAKAQAEAQAGAALQARQMGMQEQQQGLQTAQALTGMTSGLAGLGSELETAGIGRGATLAGVGMQGAQTGRGFGQQDLQNLMALQGADIGSAQAQQALQQGRFGLGSGMMNAGYMPQQQALNLLQAGLPAAEMAQRGQLRGTELQSQLGSQGLEMYMGGADMANRLQQQQLRGMLGSALGQGMTMEEQLLAALTGRDPQADNGLLGALGVGAGKTPDIIKSIGDYFGFGGGSNPLGSSADNALIESIIGTAGTKQSDSTKGMLDAFNALGIGGG